MKCSVVVPVYNPGPNLDRCVTSLLAQTMSPADYEILLVDDGSTDGTGERLDALAAEHPRLIRVEHLPGSGWPGHPRNVGTRLARGDYVHYVDNDDMLAPFALERLAAAADADHADVVFGRPASDFRGIFHDVYRRDLRGVRFEQAPILVETLSPHKMFRRSFLAAHDIAFPESLPLEDQVFVLTAYLAAGSITVLTDDVYYHYLRRIGSGRNAGDAVVAPETHFAALAQVVAAVDTAVDTANLDRARRDTVLQRIYRTEILNRLLGAAMRGADDTVRSAWEDAARAFAADPLGDGVRTGGGSYLRGTGHLLRDGDRAGLRAAAHAYGTLAARASATGVRWDGDTLAFDVAGRIDAGESALRLDPVDGRWAWPETLLPGVPVAERTLDPARDRPDARVSLRHRNTSSTYELDTGLAIDIDAGGAIRFGGPVRIDRPLADGIWDIRVRTWIGGLNRTAAIATDPAAVFPLRISADGRILRLMRSGETARLGIDAGTWLRPLAGGLADSAEITLDGARLRLTAAAEAAAPIDVRLALRAAGGETSGDAEGGAEGPPIVVAGTLVADGPGRVGISMTLPTGDATPDGDYRPYLQQADTPAEPPAPLPCILTARAGRWTLA